MSENGVSYTEVAKHGLRAKDRRRELLGKRKSLSVEDIRRLASERGLRVDDGRGKHPVHVVDPSTGRRMPVPGHGGGSEVATGPRSKLVKFIQGKI